MTGNEKTYKVLNQQTYTFDAYQIVPVRDRDKFDIMQWRNEQMYHLRQENLLTKEVQESYFQNVILKLFIQDYPEQILFSYLENDKCIGYGGLVHIDWQNNTAELSFIMATQLEKDFFEKHWTIFIKLIRQVAFEQLKLKVIFTYAYDLRPKLYPILEKAGFVFEKRIKDVIAVDNKPVDVIIHKLHKDAILLRKASDIDMLRLFHWSNDPLVRQQSFNPDKINLEEHKNWFFNKIKDSKYLILVAEIHNEAFGVVRFEINNDNAIIGISIEKNYRGKGLAGKLLKQATNYFINVYHKPVLAYIKKENIASVKSFKNAGYKFYMEETVNGFECYVFSYK